MKKIWILLLLAGSVGLGSIAILADNHGERHEGYESEHEEDDDDEGYGRRGYGSNSGAAYLADPQYALYEAECSGCHMAFPPTMLPSASWDAMMTGLEDHFGDSAELDAEAASQVAAFLSRHSAGNGNEEISERSWRATRGRTPPLRITETDYFRGKHHEIPDKMVVDNPEVLSFSRCETCHQGAERGNFDEHGVRIPGYGRWED